MGWIRSVESSGGDGLGAAAVGHSRCLYGWWWWPGDAGGGREPRRELRRLKMAMVAVAISDQATLRLTGEAAKNQDKRGGERAFGQRRRSAGEARPTAGGRREREVAMLRSVLRRGGAAVRQAVLAEGSMGAILRLRVAERERLRRRRRDPGRDEFFVATPESLAWLDSVSLPMVLTAAAVALFTKLLMMEHEATDQERRERKIKNSHPDQGKVRMLTREEWDEIQEVRPRTPFESKLARPHARIRTGEPVRLDDVKDWAIDVITDAFTRAEESAKQK